MRRRRNSNWNWPLILVGASVVGVAGFIVYGARAAPILPPAPGPTPPAGPRTVRVSTSMSGSSVTLRPGDTLLIDYPNSQASGQDWYYTIGTVLGLSYNGRTTTNLATGMVETDSFTYHAPTSGSGTGGGPLQAVYINGGPPAASYTGPLPMAPPAPAGASPVPTFNLTVNTSFP